MLAITKAAVAVIAVFTVTVPSVRGDVSIDIARIGNPSQPADATGFGHVPYVYGIATHEVTNAQYAEFLNAKYHDLVGITGFDRPLDGIEQDSQGNFVPRQGLENEPVGEDNVVNAARFVNWLHNGQGDSDTESGAYLFSNSGYILNGYDRIQRQPGARWALPNVDEWYKASYISDIALIQVSRPYPWAGEWTETILYGNMYEDWYGGYSDPMDYYLGANSSNPHPTELKDFRAVYLLTPAESFRVVSLVPEPSALALLGTGAMGLLACAWRRRTV